MGNTRSVCPVSKQRDGTYNKMKSDMKRVFDLRPNDEKRFKEIPVSELIRNTDIKVLNPKRRSSIGADTRRRTEAPETAPTLPHGWKVGDSLLYTHSAGGVTFAVKLLGKPKSGKLSRTQLEVRITNSNDARKAKIECGIPR